MTKNIDNVQKHLGSFCTLGPDVLEILCAGPVDCILLDAQHGLWELPQLREGLRATEARQVKAIVRLPASGTWMVESLLDAGFQSMVFPMVNTPAQARDCVQACYYPPLGLRSQSSCRASLHHGSDYRQQFNDRFELLVMIEHVDAVAVLDKILDVPGVCGCIIGPSDLGSSLLTDHTQQQLEECIQTTLQTCKQRGKTVGIAATDMQKAHQRFEQGFDIVFVTTDRKLLIQSVAKMKQDWKALHE